MQSPVRCNARSNAEPAPACRTPVHRGSRGIPIRHIAEFQSAARKLIEVYSSQHDPRRRGRLPRTGPARHLNPHGTHDDDKLNS